MDESQNIMLSKGSQAQTNTYCITVFIWSSKPNQINLRVWWKKSDSGYLWGGIWKGLTWKGQEETFVDENALYFLKSCGLIHEGICWNSLNTYLNYMLKYLVYFVLIIILSLENILDSLTLGQANLSLSVWNIFP